MGPVEITSENYSIVTMSEIPVVVCLASSSSSKGLKLIEAAKKYGSDTEDELLVALIDIEAQASVAQSLGAKDPASVVIVQDGYVLARSTSVDGAKALRDFVDKNLAKSRKAAEDQQIAKAAHGKRHWWHRL